MLALSLAAARAPSSRAARAPARLARGGGAAAPSSACVVAVDVGTESLRAAVVDGDGRVLASASAPHETAYPAPGHAEQAPADWWAGLGAAVKSALAEAGRGAADVRAMCLATTSCTVLALDAAGAPLRPALLWMDARAAPQAAEILRRGRGDAALAVNSGGHGPISAEWMLPKALWLKQREPETWAKAEHVCECQDWLNYKLTGELVAGGCNVATRWHCDGAAAVAPSERGGDDGESEGGDDGEGDGADKGGFDGQPSAL